MITITPAITSTEWSSVTFFLSSLSSGSLQTTASFSWSLNNEPLLNATASTYTLTPALASNAGAYKLDYTGSISSSLGTIIIGYSSSNAYLTVNPLILTQPISPSPFLEGEPQILYFNVSSSIPVSYQWLRENTPICGYTSNTASFQSTYPLQDLWGTYICAATTASGSCISNPANFIIISANNGIASPTSFTYQTNLSDGFGGRGSGYIQS